VIIGPWFYDSGAKDVLGVTVDKDIVLHGHSCFGRENNSYTVSLKIKDANGNFCVVPKAGTFSSKLLQYKDGSYYGFEVLFDSATELKKNTKYQIEALISGPPCWKGKEGFSTAHCSGMTFTFCGSHPRRMDQKIGQFPEFLFSA